MKHYLQLNYGRRYFNIQLVWDMLRKIHSLVEATKEKILTDIANDLGTTVEQVLAYLYADHKDMHILQTLPGHSNT